MCVYFRLLKSCLRFYQTLSFTVPLFDYLGILIRSYIFLCNLRVGTHTIFFIELIKRSDLSSDIFHQSLRLSSALSHF